MTLALRHRFVTIGLCLLLVLAGIDLYGHLSSDLLPALEERGFDPERTWMIGNSPKSDINPALEAGLRAVFVPHQHTWVLEKQEIRPGNGRLLTLERFADLRAYF